MKLEQVNKIKLTIGFDERYKYGVYVRQLEGYDFWIKACKNIANYIEKTFQEWVGSFIELKDHIEREAIDYLGRQFSRKTRTIITVKNKEKWRRAKYRKRGEYRDEWQDTGNLQNSVYVKVYGRR